MNKFKVGMRVKIIGDDSWQDPASRSLIGAIGVITAAQITPWWVVTLSKKPDLWPYPTASLIPDQMVPCMNAGALYE